MKHQTNYFNSYIYILYYQSSTHIIILQPVRLVFLILRVKYCLTEDLEQPGGGIPALNVMAIRGQRHTNVGKQRTLLDDVDVAPPHSTDYTTWLVNVLHREIFTLATDFP